MAAAGDLHLMNIDDPTKPDVASTYSGPGYALGVEASASLLYVNEQARRDEEGSIVSPAGLRIIDFSDPSAPHPTGFLNIGDVHSLALSGQYAYLTQRAHSQYSGALQIADISDPSNPAIVGTWESIGDPTGAVISGDFACAATRPPPATFSHRWGYPRH